jgi:hypothetical protein
MLKGGLFVSKRGVDDGNQKGGGSSQPAKKEPTTLYQRDFNCKGKNKYFLNFLK